MEPLPSLTLDEMKNLLLSVGTHHGARKLSPIEVALLLQKTIAAGATLEHCAETIHLNTTMVGRFVALLNLPDDVQHLIGWGRKEQTIGFSPAFELSRLADSEDQRKAVMLVLQSNFSSSEVRQLTQMKIRSTKSIEECASAVLKMRPQVEVRHILIGSVLSSQVAAILENMTQEDRDTLLRRVLANNFLQLQATGRLASKRFTLVGGEELARAIKAEKDIIEKKLNSQLEKELLK